MDCILNTKETKALVMELNFCGLSYRCAGNIVAQWRHWEKHHGIHFVVSYLKQLKSNLKQSKGDTTHIESLTKLSKIPMDFSKGIAKIALNLYRSKRSFVTRALNILSMHGRWSAPEPKLKDFEAFSRFVGKKPVIDVESVDLETIFHLSQREVRRFISCIATSSDFSYKQLRSKSSHYVRGGKSVPGDTLSTIDQLWAMLDAPALFLQHVDLIANSGTGDSTSRDQLEEVTEGLKRLLGNVDLGSRNYVGKVVGLTKDRSLKTRYIANLAKGWQVCLTPYAAVLKKFVKGCPESATFDQLAAVDWMIEKINEGCSISSVDLVQATDTIPYRLLERVIEGMFFSDSKADLHLRYYYIIKDFERGTLGVEDALSLLLEWDSVESYEWSMSEDDVFEVLEDVAEKKGLSFDLVERRLTRFLQSFRLDVDINAKAYFRTKPGVDVKYETGQAMGRLPSKSLLDMTMILMARSCGGSKNNFRVNGDDIFFTDLDVALNFVSLLNRCNIPVSPPKTFLDKDFGEFSGKFADAFGILKDFKKGPYDINNDPLGLLRKYGKKALKAAPDDLKPVFEYFYHLSTTMGGLSQGGTSPFDVLKRILRLEEPMLTGRQLPLEGYSEGDINLMMSSTLAREAYKSIPRWRLLKPQFMRKCDWRNVEIVRRDLDRELLPGKFWFVEPIYALNVLKEHINSSQRVVSTSDGEEIPPVPSWGGKYVGLDRLTDALDHHVVTVDTESSLRRFKTPLSVMKRFYKLSLKLSRRALAVTLSAIANSRKSS